MISKCGELISLLALSEHDSWQVFNSMNDPAIKVGSEASSQLKHCYAWLLQEQREIRRLIRETEPIN